MIYLDYAATTPMGPEALRTYQDVAGTFYGNANSLHTRGTDAANVLNVSLETLRQTIGDVSVAITRSGSEANQHVIHRLLSAKQFQGHILSCRTEHPSIRDYLRDLADRYPALQLEDVPVDEQGNIHPKDVEDRIKPDTILATFAHVQHEIGTIRDIRAIGTVLARAGVPFHSDCVQAYGKIPIPMQDAHLSAISTAAHKIHGPKGLGAVFFSKMMEPNDELPPGTADVAAIAAFAEAADMQMKKGREAWTHIGELRAKMAERLPVDFRVLGEIVPERQSPYILGVRLPEMEGQEAMLACDREGIAIATGSACRSGDHGPSETLLALGYSPDRARTFIRLSFAYETSFAEVEEAALKLMNIRSRRAKNAPR
ncbi:aminotransferase class V-fold PLP-dependent enzyme [Salicibibacter halophilus]|uniref:Aminotransferase class V-fold PLP-dependent enzyme n=1 Tax=Salicibibacter halophilus TaxID=2502791 RepID=A0A514LJV4_9BACI|nr:IscS subfamily cysteine desulfurase [Salicibibacter halophilus]QDI92129.1 aminotransferase class V-fold PLP-dependent enzyme [Salicibibacter halophilus]